jgi:nitrate reductase NapE component
MAQVVDRAVVASSGAPVTHEQSLRRSRSGMVLVALGLLLIFAVGLVGGWNANSPPHTYQTSLAGLGWSMSVPLGILVLVLGAARLARVEARLFGVMAVAMLAVFGWTVVRSIATWPNAQPPSLLFGIGGTLMVLFFVGILWHWARGRSRISARNRAVADLRLFGLAFMLIAAWEVCGLFGSPVFLLRPALAAESPLAEYAVPVAATALVYLTVGFGLVFAASHIEAGSPADST